jgi:hypothetical protein
MPESAESTVRASEPSGRRRLFSRHARRHLLSVAAMAGALVAPAQALAAPSTKLLVKFHSGVAASAVDRALGAVGGHDHGTIRDLGIHVVSVPSTAADHARAALSSDAGVAFAELDGTARPQEQAADNPDFPSGSFAVLGGAWGWQQTHTTQAWDVTEGDPSVVIAILDTGLKPQGLNFGNQIVPGWNVLNRTSDTATNAGNHGTYVAGVAVMAMNTAAGNAGYCPKCMVMPVQVGTDSGAQYSDMAAGITWAADHGARVENLSWAGAGASSTLASAVSYARSKGVVVTAAAGNSNCDCTTYPSGTPGVLGVAGVDNTGAKAADSNYGSWVALAAPEGSMTAWPTLNGAPGYGPVGGTSLAAPAVAGIAGLLFSSNTALTGSQVEQALESSATPVPFTVAHGEVDAMAALRSLGSSDPQQAVAPANSSPPRVLVETNGDYSTTQLTVAPQVGQVLMRDPGAWQGSSPLTLSAVQWQRCNANGCAAAGTSYKYTVQSTDAGYSLRVVVTYSDPNGQTSATSAQTAAVGGGSGGGGSTTSPPANISAPTISGTSQSGQTLTASTGSWSNTPTSYAYQWSRCDSTGANCASVSGATASTYALGSADVGSTIRVAVAASNSGGSGTATSSATAAVEAGSQTLTFAGTIGGKGQAVSYTAVVGAGLADAQLAFSGSKCGSSMGLAVKTSAGVTLASTSGPSVLVLDPSLSAGSYVYVVTGLARCSFTLTVTAPTS